MNDLSPTRDPDVQEALSIRYQTAAIAIPLQSGRFAVFANDRTIDSLVICAPEDLHLVVASRAKMAPRRTDVPQALPAEKAAAIDFSDL